ncbi:3-hydroxyacyl-CoA dehydrogenase NAD-binding domain-containing protein [Rhodovulum adriaticum]|uniref:Carnitine 3-dehydrogenase n=1 Tax=Rhodovulum adriaticum TaxID=35804 RepID=A0A4V2SKX7_RHOAD|nr:3-hydroxyacyl-CoA dehydrogenase NAD-binding domain-containing protein [Rhodovulum adriaticum]MBK1634628.1 hypothetical protein [Rhodovulum adriaticum]TCP21256.1 carnitine 3-dehydrogenase [Rhodovulum adriaticum]
MTGVVAILGAGQTGVGWAARFALMGWAVRVFDPDPATAERLEDELARARRALPGLHDTPLPPEGRVEIVPTISQAVTGADWVQESVPERLDLKRALLQKVQEHCADGAIVASSSSTLSPEDLSGPGARPLSVLIAHPQVPVYLVPLVELVAAPDAPQGALDRAREVLTGIGMAPQTQTAAGAGRVSARLSAALWREALWLLKEGRASTTEIDAAIRDGLGPLWAQMGPAETCALAGAEAAQATAQPGLGDHLPALPAMDEGIAQALLAAAPDDAAARTRARDTDLVGILRALKWTGQGAGAHLAALDVARDLPPGDITRPIVTQDRAVPLDWTDYNGHMTESRYLYAFADATDRFMEIIGCDAAYIATGGSYFTVETHIRHIAEVHAGARFRVETTCLDGAGKKMHLFHQMYAGDRLLATGEHLLLHVSLESRRTAPPAPQIAQRLGEIAEAHAALPRPEGVGRAVGQRPG